ncbi:tetratricopeptide repeat protein [Lutibacter sp.]|uniref:tetratricopeptide repeat protein n=1 Tax=Lutibacter sp. TaxID=1925666 RepID=UPI0025C263B1|nr:tetratricopeptide repeat protein [Lutibacter sp.]MCF6167121.1 carboxypeptidase-like regulatory domain-containing protein [Lutibacter sp.]
MSNIKKTGINIITYIFVVFCIHSQHSLYSQNKLFQIKKNTPLKEISGTVSSLGILLRDVNVVVKNTNRGTKTNNKGFYVIKAKEGEVLKFTFVGMIPLEIIIEDITAVLNIEMNAIVNKLKEVTVNNKRNRKDKSGLMGRPDVLTTTFGNINTEKVGYSINYINGANLNLTAMDLWTAIRYKIPKLSRGTSFSLNTKPIWDIDGVIYETINGRTLPPIDLANVKDVYVIRSLAGTVKYGAAGANGVIVVRTKSSTFDNKPIATKTKLYSNKKYYEEDAVTFKNFGIAQPDYFEAFDSISNLQLAYIEYQKLLPSYKNQFEFYFDMANYFQQIYKDEKGSLKILSKIETRFERNPEVLKVLAYTYQKRGLYQKALKVYKKIIKIRPNYAQSFRDLANAYSNLNQYQKAWKMYMNYFYRGNNLENEGIGQVIYNEMEALFVQHKKQANIKELFLVRDSANITKDVRMVFEWNTSEAEFDIEFVNPQKQVYSFKHTLSDNNSRIKHEKRQGYSSETFFIENLTKGNWYVNFTYFGNKQNVPTYLKLAVYYNWGKPNQIEKIHLFKLKDKNKKWQLLALNYNHLLP